MQRQESKICDWVLAADEKVQFAMAIDELGNLLCLKSLGLYSLPNHLATRLAEMIAVMAGGIFKELATHHGPFEYLIIKHDKIATVGLRIKEGYLIFVAKEEEIPEVVQRVKEILGLTEKEKSKK
jgi:hypothetical protein